MPLSHFWAANLALHGPIGCLYFLLALIPEDRRMLPPSRKQGDEAALRKGLPYRLMRLTSSFQHLTVCTHCLAAAYLAAACLGRRGMAGALREVLGPAGCVVGIGFWALAVANPWHMFPRGDFPADDAAAESAVNLLLRPSLRMPQAAVHALLQVVGPRLRRAGGLCSAAPPRRQVQHTAMPLIVPLEVALYSGELPPLLPAGPSLLLVVGYGCLYVWWSHRVCWWARGVPPYPVLDTVWRDGSWLKLYGALIGLGLGCWAGERFLLR